MHSFKRLIPALAALAPLAVPAAGQAAETIGSSFSNVEEATPVSCGASSCTLINDAPGFDRFRVLGDRVITRWSAKLSAGTRARVVIVDRDGGGFRKLTEGDTVTGDGSVQTVKAHLPIPAGDHVLALDVLQGSAMAVADPYSDLRVVAPALSSGQTGTGPVVNSEVLFSAESESDLDRDGKGDDTEDDCVSNCSTPDPGQGGGDGGAAGGNGGGGNGGGGNGGGGNGGEVLPPPPAQLAASSLLVGPRAARDGKKMVFQVAELDGIASTAKVSVVVAGETIEKGFKFKLLPGGKPSYLTTDPLPKALLAKLKKRGSLPVTIALSATADGKTVKATKKIKLVQSGPVNPYDGYYKGTDGLVFIVEWGVMRTVSKGFNQFCSNSNTNQQGNFSTNEDEPIFVKPNGTFAWEGSANSGHHKFDGKLTPNGAGKGYISTYNARMTTGSGFDGRPRIEIDPCQGATNWTAKRSKR